MPAALTLLLAAAIAFAGCATARPGASGDASPPPAALARRSFHPFDGERWIGRGISYGPHRDGQRPGGASPTRAEIREDLALLRGRWDLLRLYASDGPTPDVLAVLREDRLPFKVLLGAWIEPETGPDGTPIPGAREANAAQVAGAVRLAAEHPGLVLALVVGNETQVSWSAHKLPATTLVHWIREARRASRVPVTTADDFGYWLEPRSDEVAREIDLLVTHVYAMWNGQELARALDFTREKYAAVAARHPGLPLVLGEAGWATRRHSEGEQARLIRGEASEAAQRTFHEAFTAWVVEERIASTWFEAFDEGWKGGPHPDEVEKHWGLFRADRTPKAALAGAP